MLYLVTDQNNKTWRDVIWGENVTHVEENPNFYFPVYDNILVASYMYPAYDHIKDPKIWLCTDNTSLDPYTGLTDRHKSQTSFRNKYAQLTTLSEVSFQNPTIEQRIAFGILCAMSLVLNPIFRNWALAYLRGEDCTKEAAHKASELICDQLGEKIPVEHQYVDCVHPVFASIMLEPAEFSGNAAHRAYFDAIDMGFQIDLEKLAVIASTIPHKEIADFLA